MLKNLGEIVVSFVFLLLLLFKLDPFHWLMPSEVQMVLLALAVVAFGLYTGLLFRERAHDEREAFHLHRASRGAYIGGVTLLLAGIVYQSFKGPMDPWLTAILAGMIIIKMVILIWSRFRN